MVILKGLTGTFGVPTTGGVFDPGIDTSNYMTDLVSVTNGGNTVQVDFGTNDTLTGTNGTDIVSVHNGNDTAYGGASGDVFYDLGLGNDTFFGDGGADQFFLGAGNDTVHGGEGEDQLNYSAINYSVIADLQTGFIFADGIDQVDGIENIVGSQWNDTMFGRDAHETFYGGLGNDKLVGRGGNDTVHGGAGNDTIYGDGTTSADRGFGADTLFGDDGNDWINGGLANDMLDGGAGDDTLLGGEGNDWLIGGGGNDKMTGGTGADTFVFRSTSDMPKADRITDFQHGVDKIDLSQIDANPNVAGNQSFSFDWWGTSQTSGAVSIHPGPLVQGATGHVDVYYQPAPSGTVGPGHTWVYVETNDHKTGASIMLDGHVTLTAADFIL